MRRIGLVAAAVLSQLACESGNEPPFPSTAFRSLRQVDVAGGGGSLDVSADGRLLFVQTGGATNTYVLPSDPSEGLPSPDVAVQGSGALRTHGDLLLLPLQQNGLLVARTRDDGRTFETVATSSIPTSWVHVSDDRVVLSHAGSIALLDRDRALGSHTDLADALLSFDMPMHRSPSQDVALKGDVLFVASDAGTVALDLTDPAAPTELYTLGDWFSTELRLHGDLLFVSQGYDAGAYDLTDPLNPVPLAFLNGGMGLATHGDYLYTVDRSNLFIHDLTGAVPTPVRYLNMVDEYDRDISHLGDCGDVAVPAQGIVASCAGNLHWLAPNEP